MKASNVAQGSSGNWMHKDTLPAAMKKASTREAFLLIGAGEMNRTPDLLITNEKFPVLIGVVLEAFQRHFSCEGTILGALMFGSR